MDGLGVRPDGRCGVMLRECESRADCQDQGRDDHALFLHVRLQSCLSDAPEWSSDSSFCGHGNACEKKLSQALSIDFVISVLS